MRFNTARTSRDTIESAQSSTSKWSIPPHPNDSPIMGNQNYNTMNMPGDNFSISARGRTSKFGGSNVSNGSRPSTPLGHPPTVTRTNHNSNNAGSRSSTPLQNHRANSFRVKTRDVSPFQRNVGIAPEEEEVEEYLEEDSYRDDGSNVRDRIMQFGGNASRSSTPVPQRLQSSQYNISNSNNTTPNYDPVIRSNALSLQQQLLKEKGRDASPFQRNIPPQQEENQQEECSSFQDNNADTEVKAVSAEISKLSLQQTKRNQDIRNTLKQEMRSSPRHTAESIARDNSAIILQVKDNIKEMGVSIDSKLQRLEERLNEQISSRMESLEANMDVRLEEIYGLLVNITESRIQPLPLPSPSTSTLASHSLYQQQGSQKQQPLAASDSVGGGPPYQQQVLHQPPNKHPQELQFTSHQQQQQEQQQQSYAQHSQQHQQYVPQPPQQQYAQPSSRSKQQQKGPGGRPLW